MTDGNVYDDLELRFRVFGGRKLVGRNDAGDARQAVDNPCCDVRDLPRRRISDSLTPSGHSREQKDVKMDVTILERARNALQEQHRWHLSRTDPEFISGVSMVPADDYSDSSMCERTTSALDELDGEIARRARITGRIKEIMRK